MLDKSRPQNPDSFSRLIEMCAADRRAQKLDLLVGVYRNESGQTPIMSAVKLAEERLRQIEDSKGYLAVTGRESFSAAIIDLVVGGELRTRAAGIQSVGGAGALRLLFDLVKRLHPDSAVWLSDPGYPGHYAIALAAGLRVRRFPYLNTARTAPDEERILGMLSTAKRGDLIVLDGSCHNPTGMDMSHETWLEIAWLCQSRGLIPLVDVAYQGLSRGLEADTAGVAILAGVVDYVLVAVSCSKTFGIYRERAGSAIVIGPSRQQLTGAMQALAEISFGTYGIPPDHGAAIVDMVLRDADLRAVWQAELAEARRRLAGLRTTFTGEIATRLERDDFDHIRKGTGLFSLLPLSQDQMRRLRDEYAIYGLDNGRINLACLTASRIDTLADAIGEVTRQAVC